MSDRRFVIVHIGSGAKELQLINEILEETEIPIRTLRLIWTYVNSSILIAVRI